MIRCGLLLTVHVMKFVQEVYEAHKEHLLHMGKAAYLFGPVGKGSQMKLVVNMTMGTVMASFAEGLALCEASDLPADQLLEVRNKQLNCVNGSRAEY